MLTLTCSASIPLPGGRFGRCNEVATQPFRSQMYCDKHREMALKTEARFHPAFGVFQTIMEAPDVDGRCKTCLGTAAVCRCDASPDGLA